jgi:hypothetical protein
MTSDKPPAVASNALFETFCVESYFGQWCVRKTGERRWGHCFHVASKEEAEGLAQELTALEQVRLIVTTDHESKEAFIARVRSIISNNN